MPNWVQSIKVEKLQEGEIANGKIPGDGEKGLLSFIPTSSANQMWPPTSHLQSERKPMGRFTMTYLGFASDSEPLAELVCSFGGSALHSNNLIFQGPPSAPADSHFSRRFVVSLQHGLPPAPRRHAALAESAFNVSFLEAHDIQTTYSVITCFFISCYPICASDTNTCALPYLIVDVMQAPLLVREGQKKSQMTSRLSNVRVCTSAAQMKEVIRLLNYYLRDIHISNNHIQK